MTIVNQLEKLLGKERVEVNKDLFPYLTLRTSVKAGFFFEAKSREDFQKAVRAVNQLGLEFLVLGGGSNLAIVKNKISGLVIKNNYIKKEVLKENKKEVILLVSSGYPISYLVKETVEAGWEGFEYHQGLPGTVGGAIYGNAKWTRPLHYFGDDLVYAYLLNKKGRIRRVDNQYFQFGYDWSIIQKTKEIVLEAVFQLKKTDPLILKKRAQYALGYRKKTQPFGLASSGCFFKNVGNISAGYLIDKCNLKGYSVGDFYVSQKHANFIINRGKGKSEDLIKLVKLIKEKVKKKFGVRLEEEVVLI